MSEVITSQGDSRQDQMRQFASFVDEQAVTRYVDAAAIANAALGDVDYVSVHINRNDSQGTPFPEGRVYLTLDGNWVHHEKHLSPYWIIKDALFSIERSVRSEYEADTSTYVPRHAKPQE